MNLRKEMLYTWSAVCIAGMCEHVHGQSRTASHVYKCYTSAVTVSIFGFAVGFGRFK